MKKKIRALVSQELLHPTFAMTTEYLTKFEVDYQDGIPTIERIELNKKNGMAIAYVKVKNELFYLTFCFSISEQIELHSVETAPLYVLSFPIVSEKYTLSELLNCISIKPKSTQKDGKGKLNEVDLGFCNKPGKLIDKINHLLDFLEGDKKGVKNLIKKTKRNAVWITIVYYNGYGTFTDLYLPKKVIKRLSSFGLQLVFDIYGTPYS